MADEPADNGRSLSSSPSPWRKRAVSRVSGEHSSLDTLTRESDADEGARREPLQRSSSEYTRLTSTSGGEGSLSIPSLSSSTSVAEWLRGVSMSDSASPKYPTTPTAVTAAAERYRSSPQSCLPSSCRAAMRPASKQAFKHTTRSATVPGCAQARRNGSGVGATAAEGGRPRASSTDKATTEMGEARVAEGSFDSGGSGAARPCGMSLPPMYGAAPLEVPPPIQDERNRLYEVLGMRRDFTDPHELRAAYKREALKVHPDRVEAALQAGSSSTEAGAASADELRQACLERFQEVQLAFQTLSDPMRRHIYDTFGYRCIRDQRLTNMVIQLSAYFRRSSDYSKRYRARLKQLQRLRHESSGTWDADDFTPRYGFTGLCGPAFAWWDNGCSVERATRRGLEKCLVKLPPMGDAPSRDRVPCGTVTMPSRPLRQMPPRSATMSALPPSAVRRPSPPPPPAPVPSRGDPMRCTPDTADIVHEIWLDLADFYNGRSLRVGVERKGFSLSGDRCTQECLLTVDVERGARDGDSVVFPGCADASEPGAEPGAVVIVLREKRHPRLRRVDDDLHMRKRISLAEALCGYSFPLRLLDGRTVMVQSGDGCVTRPGCVRRLRGKGMPRRDSASGGHEAGKDHQAYGDLFIEFDVYWPRNGVVTGSVRECIMAALASLGPDAWDMGYGCGVAAVATTPDEPMSEAIASSGCQSPSAPSSDSGVPTPTGTGSPPRTTRRASRGDGSGSGGSHEPTPSVDTWSEDAAAEEEEEEEEEAADAIDEVITAERVSRQQADRVRPKALCTLCKARMGAEEPSAAPPAMMTLNVPEAQQRSRSGERPPAGL